jgi:hypothetical protein
MGGNIKMPKKGVKQSWSHLLNTLNKVDKKEESWTLGEKTKVPLTPIDIDADVLYYLLEFLYPKFINDQQNLLDIIISNDASDIKEIYLYRTEKAGIFTKFEKIDPDEFKIKGLDLKEIKSSFDKIQAFLMEKYDLRIANLRLFKEETFSILNDYLNDINEVSLDEFIIKFFSTFGRILRDDLFEIYPKPNAYLFLEDLLEFFGDFNLEGALRKFFDLLPEFNIAVYLNSKRFPLILKITNLKGSMDYSNIKLEIFHPKQLAILHKEYKKQDLMEEIKEKLNVENVYYLNQEDVVEILNDLFEKNIPIEEEALKLLFQKIVFAFRSFEIKWFKEPRPLPYNVIIRFLLRLISFNYNLKKVSHWEIPNFLFTSWKRNFGLKEHLLILVTDIKNTEKSKLKKNGLKASLLGAFSVKVENASIVKIKSVKKDFVKNIIKDNKNLQNIYSNFIEAEHSFSAILKLDQTILRGFLNTFVFNLPNMNLFSKMITIKKIKNKDYFDIFPNKPLIKMLREKGTFTLIKTLLPIFIDKHEF